MSLSSLSARNVSLGASAVASAAQSNQAIAAPAQTQSSAAVTSYTPTPADTGAALTYAMPVSAGGASWEYANSDAVSQVMAGDVAGKTLATRFAGLGAALLERFKTSTSDFAQSVVIPPPAGQGPAKPNPAISGAVTLDVTTASGTTVELDITSGSDGTLAVQEKSSGALSAAQQTALANLAGAFQGAIDGLTGGANGDAPSVELSGLLQVDPTVLSSVNLQIQLQSESASPTTLSLQVDSAQRSLAARLPAGTVNISVNLANASVIGTQAQQKVALTSYLQQFQQEESRDQGEDTDLMAAFRDGFTQLNSHYPVAGVGANASGISVQSDQNQAMLTGLADFQASVTATPISSNSLKRAEVDQFAYQLSQQTAITGNSYANRTITQKQSSSLIASYHQWFAPPLTQLQTTKLKLTQNYYYEQMNDSASVTTMIGYDKGKLVQASIAKSASQSTHETKFVDENEVEDTTVTIADMETEDLMPLLVPLQSDAPKDAARRQQVLAAINAQVYLQSDPLLLPFDAALAVAAPSGASGSTSSA
ncbi:MAG: hypothetical protein P4L91_00820 [Burkholderiaceae bacterium]|nr:hypothetical protein [Burkholderiaceae bacterium]